MEFLILCVGTDGDFLPLVPLSRNLAARGHDVTLLGPPPFSYAARQSGLGFIPLWTADEQARFEKDIERMGGRYGLRYVSKHAIGWTESAYRIIQSLHSPGMTLLAPDHTAIWADVAASVQLGCRVIRFLIDPPHLPDAPGAAPDPPFGLVQNLLALQAAMDFQASVARLGLDPSRFSLSALPNARQGIPRFALWPEWLTPDVRDSRVRRFGFLYSEGGSLPPEDLERAGDLQRFAIFIAGPRANLDRWSVRFFRAALEASRRLGIGALLLRGTPPECELPKWAKWRASAPFSEVLPRASILVHHGGIGAAAAGIRHGLPQVLIPRLASQFTNAACLRRCGVACSIAHDRIHADVLYRYMARALGDNRMRRRARELSLRIDTHRDTENACDFIEEFSRNHSAIDYPDATDGKSLIP